MLVAERQWRGEGMRWFKAWTGLVLIALLAAGCVRFEGNITINPIADFGSGGDGSIDGSDDGKEPSTGSEGIGEEEGPPGKAPAGTPGSQKVELNLLLF